MNRGGNVDIISYIQEQMNLRGWKPQAPYNVQDEACMTYVVMKGRRLSQTADYGEPIEHTGTLVGALLEAKEVHETDAGPTHFHVEDFAVGVRVGENELVWLPPDYWKHYIRTLNKKSE